MRRVGVDVGSCTVRAMHWSTCNGGSHGRAEITRNTKEVSALNNVRLGMWVCVWVLGYGSCPVALLGQGGWDRGWVGGPYVLSR